MHAHDQRTRQCQLPGAPPVIPIARHRCAHPECGAQWQTLPGFLARHLHFNWPHVQTVCGGGVPQGRQPSRSTKGRWLGRLLSSAAQLVRLACDAGGETAEKLRDAIVETRRQFIDVLALPFAEVAAWVHQLQRGVRLM
jgi:hypothetical protein